MKVHELNSDEKVEPKKKVFNSLIIFFVSQKREFWPKILIKVSFRKNNITLAFFVPLWFGAKDHFLLRLCLVSMMLQKKV